MGTDHHTWFGDCSLVIADCLRSDYAGLAAPERVFVVTIGIAPQPSPPVPQKRGAGLTILYLSALAKAKWIFDLLAAMPLVLASRPYAKLTVAGEWFRLDEETAARQFVREHGLERAIQFLGPVHGEAKGQLWRAADLFVFPPHAQKEAFGIVLLEAMQAGTPTWQRRFRASPATRRCASARVRRTARSLNPSTRTSVTANG